MFINIKDARKHYGEGETLVNALDGVSLSLILKFRTSIT